MSRSADAVAAICVVCHDSSPAVPRPGVLSGPHRRPVPMIAKGFTPEIGAKVFVIMKIPARGARRSLARGTKPVTPRSHVTLEHLPQGEIFLAPGPAANLPIVIRLTTGINYGIGQRQHRRAH